MRLRAVDFRGSGHGSGHDQRRSLLDVSSVGESILLLGSGISIPAGMPGVTALTQQVISGQNVVRYAGSFLVLDAAAPNESDLVRDDEVILRLVRALAERASDFYGRYAQAREIDYEELAFLTTQLADCVLEYENPALAPLLRELRDELHLPQAKAVVDIASAATDYILGSLWSILRRPPIRLDHLDTLIAYCRAQPDGVALVTLNHDTVLEQALRRAGLAFTDGFEEEPVHQPADELRSWSDSFPEPVRLLKLHGSVNWYRIWIDDRQVVVRSDAADPYHLGERFDFPADARGQFLAGTFNKALAYSSPVYADEHARFHEWLACLGRCWAIDGPVRQGNVLVGSSGIFARQSAVALGAYLPVYLAEGGSSCVHVYSQLRCSFSASSLRSRWRAVRARAS